MPESDAILILVSCPKILAKTMAHTLVTERLAGCVSILSEVTSIYYWEGEIEEQSEDLLLIKSMRSHWLRLVERLKEMHSYELPEILSIPIESGYLPYLAWLKETVKGQAVLQGEKEY